MENEMVKHSGKMESEIVKHLGYEFTVRNLRRVFTAVQNKQNWKKPVRYQLRPKKLTPRRIALLDAATQFYGAGPVSFSFEEGKRMFLVAPGYYEVIGA